MRVYNLQNPNQKGSLGDMMCIACVRSMITFNMMKTQAWVISQLLQISPSNSPN